MEKINFNNIIEKFLIIFLCIQPIFDLEIFYNSYSTLIRVVIIFLLFIYFFFKSNNRKKYWLLLYPAFLGIYFIFHHINALKFHSLVPGNFNYSILKEVLYFAKMLTPFLLIYCLYKSNVDTKTIIKILVAIISTTIVITNFLGISHTSYGGEKIKGNFFTWFNTDLTYADLSSKGFFEYANQVGAILIMFLPFTIYSVFNNDNFKKKILDITLLIVNVLALILLCTRVSVLGIIVVFAFSIFAFILVSLIKKQHIVFKKYISLVAIIVVYAAILPINPMFTRLDQMNNATAVSAEANLVETPLEETSTELIPETTDIVSIEPIEENIVTTETQILQDNNADNDIINYIESNYESKQLYKQFLFENYPYQYDPEFWYNFLQNTDTSSIINFRYVETAMVKRVIQINNNPMDKLFGITNTRLQNIFNIERDFVVQYYALGIVGLILVFLPYFILLIAFAYKTLKSKLKNLDYINVLSFISILFAFGISYFSGNLLNSLSFTIYFALPFIFIIDKNKK